MKKLVGLLLCICMAFGAIFSLSSCTKNPPNGGYDSEWLPGWY